MKLGKTPTEWLAVDALDRALILTHLANEADKCPGCGTYLSEATQPHVVIVDEIVCHRCAALEHHAKDHESTPGGHRFTYPEPETQAEADTSEQ